MTEDVTTPQRPIHLNFHSVEQIVVVPDNEDRFCVTMREAAQACKRAEDEKEWQQDFNRFLVFLHQWGTDHATLADSLLVKVSDGTLNVLVCTVGEWYDTDLDDTISGLDLTLVKEFPWLVADVMQVPRSVLRGDRIPIEKAILVYGDGKRTPGESRPQPSALGSH